MEVKPGYKQTDVGVIPEDWESIALGRVAELTSSKRIFESDYVSTGVPFFRGKEISLLVECKPIEDPYFISEKRYLEIKAQFGAPERGDILVTAVGTLGNVFVVGNQVPFYFKDGNLIWLRKVRRVLPEYVAIQLRSRRAEVLNSAIGSSQKALTIVVLRDIRIPFPPLPEQRAIAEVLIDVDELLAGLDRIITKKRDLKQATMQQLLTGQTRLPSFHAEWEVVNVGETATKVGSGITPTGGESVYKSEGRPFLRSQNVGWGTLLLEDVAFIDDAIHSTFADTEIKSDDVFLNITGASIGRSSVADRRVEGGNVNQHVCIIRTDQRRLIPRFLNYVMLSTIGQRQIDSFQAGGNRQGLNFAQVRSIRLQLPSLPEQTAIAEVLWDMDVELEKLEQRREKTRGLKQAMMQELLTGKTRLV
jgi:type I restriction enzyme, S subunit